MRRRIARVISDCLGDSNRELSAARFLEAELGIGVTEVGSYQVYVSWERFLGNCSLGDFLDSVTLIYRFALQNGLEYRFRTYQYSITRVFRECNVGYRLDTQCGIHPFVDAVFENSRASAISGVGRDRFGAARAHLELIETALMGDPPDHRQAIRSVFDSVENIFKMTFPGETHVNRAAILNKLRPAIEKRYADRPTVKNAMLKLCEGFKNWVEAAHFYRHADNQPDPAQPPKDLTVLLISQGYGWVRWLAEMDRTIHADIE